MTTQQPEALRLAEILEGDYSPAWLYERGVYEVSAELRRQHARITELEAARFAYASEFAPTSDGDPDVSSIHANIRALKVQLEAIRAAAELRRLHAENETLRAGYAAARLEIESLRSQAPQQEAQEPCPTCAALARTVMLDQVSFDRKPDCYGIRQITDDESVEEWEDIRTSPDVAREEANDMMATGRGEIYEVVPPWTTPQPPTAQAADSVQEDAARSERERICAAIKVEDDYCVEQGDYMLDSDDCIKIARGEWVRPDYSVDAARKQGATQ